MAASTPRASAMTALFLATLLWTGAFADPYAPCYFPGGDFAPGYFPCIAYGAPVSSCCAPGWTCFSNSLCIATTETRSFPNITLGAVQRGACTSPKWNNEFCGSVCLTGDNADGHLAACGNDKYCCWADFVSGECDCSNGGGSFVLRPGLAQTIIQVTDATFTGLSPSVSIASRPPSPTADVTSTTSSASRGASGTASSSSSTGDGGAEPTAEGGSQGGDEGGDKGGDDGNKGKNLKIGLAVAIPVAVVLACVVVYFLWRRHRARGRGGYGGGGGMDGLAENNPYGPNVEQTYHRHNT